MPERFSEDEARRIFARAAERQHTDDAAPPGLSLAELQEIGRAAGLDPAHIAAAATEVRADAPDASQDRVWGLDLSPRAVRLLPGTVSDEAWEQMVSRLRRTFKTRGTPTDVGRLREWTGTNSQGGLSNLHAVLEPVAGGTRVTLETSRAKEAAQLRALPIVMAVTSAFLTALLFLIGDGAPAAAFAVGAAPLLIGVLISMLSRRAYGQWAAQRQGEFDALLDEFERIVRDTGAPSVGAGAVSLDAPALDLDGLADVPAEAAPPAAASRHQARP